MKFVSSSVMALAAFCTKATTKHCASAEDIAGEIPIWTEIDPVKGPIAVTHVSISGGSSNVPMIVDTGSSAISFCKPTDMGSSEPTGYYGCSSYGESTATEEQGWAGELYETNLILGSDNETFAVPAVKAFKMDVYGNDGTTHICGTPSLSGIMGVDPFPVVIHDTPRTNVSVEQCPPVANTNTTTNITGQFLSSAVTAGDLYTFGFIGMSPDRNSSDKNGDSVFAFGETAQERVQNSDSVGSASFTARDLVDTSNYSFEGPVTYEFVGLKDDNCTDLFINGDCSYTYEPLDDAKANITEQQKKTNLFIDSGTPGLMLPTVFLPQDFQPLITDTTVLTITVGEAILEFDADFLKYLIDLGALAGISYTGEQVLGLPVFWKYDILFDVKIDELEVGSESSYGGVTFYERPHSHSVYNAPSVAPVVNPSNNSTKEAANDSVLVGEDGMYDSGASIISCYLTAAATSLAALLV